MKLYCRFLFSLLPSLLLLGLWSCSGDGQAKQGQNSGQRGGSGGRGAGGRGEAVHVKSARPQRIAIQRMVDLSGSLVSPDQVRVSGEVGGMIAILDADLGQEVR